MTLTPDPAARPRPRPPIPFESRVALCIAACACVLHLVVATRYGWFRDELYYVACGEHLALGYVDHPPFVALVARGVRALFGDGLFPLRAVAAMTGAGTIALTGEMARRLGAGAFGVALASLSAFIAPLFLSIDGFFSMNVFDIFFWSLAASIVIALLYDRSTTPRWVLLGVVVGVGLENKLSMGFFAAGFALGVVATSARVLLKTRGPWLALAVAAAIYAPNVLWQITHDFMTLEFMNHARMTKNAVLSPGQFLGEQLKMMHPITAPIWVSGLVALLIAERFRALRPLGVAYLFTLVVFMTSRGKAYYVGPAYPFLLAAGGATLDRVRLPSWGRGAALVALVAAGALSLPLVVPVLAPEALLRYQARLGLGVGSAERGGRAVFEQRFADEFGWDTLVLAVASARDKLPADEQRDVGIFAQNYGEAGAVDVLGPRFGLPPAMSGHNSYWLWGPRGRASGPILIIGGSAEEHADVCGSVTPLAHRSCPYCMPYEQELTVWLCRELKISVPAVWPRTKHFD